MDDYPSTSPTKRSSAVKIMLHPDMAQKLRALADHLGQTPATLASIAVSQYVAQQTLAIGATERAVEGLFSHIAPDVLGALQKILGGVPEAQKPQVVEEQKNAVDFFAEEQGKLDLKSGRSASEALSEVLKKSGALVKAEESNLGLLSKAAADMKPESLARATENKMSANRGFSKTLGETSSASDSLAMALKTSQAATEFLRQQRSKPDPT